MSNKKIIAERLRALASSENRPIAARLRDVIDDVEVALGAGVSRSAVLAELADHGLEMSLSTFETTLKRLRRKRRESLIASGHLADSRGEQAEDNQASVANDPETGTHDPAELDRILADTPDLQALSKVSKSTRKMVKRGA